MHPVLLDVRFWLTSALCFVIVVMLVSGKDLKGRGWLVAFVTVSWVITAAFYLPRLGAGAALSGDLAPVLIAVDGASWLLLLCHVRGVRRQDRAAAAARRAQFVQSLDADTEHDLVTLFDHQAVAVGGTGKDITQVVARAQNLAGKPLRVVVLPGTCFASTGAHQNMVAVDTTRFALAPNAVEDIVLRAACVNADRPIPGGTDSFAGVRRVSDSLTRFLQHAINASPMVRQAGIWAITDNYTAADVQSHLVAQDREGNRRSAVTDADIAEARRLLGLAGASHRL